MPQTIARRFFARARAITVSAVAAVALGLLALVIVALIALQGGASVAQVVATQPAGGILIALIVAVGALGATVAALAVSTRRHARSLQSLISRYPDDVVFLARRLPPVVSDLPSFLKAKGIDAEFGDGWYPGTAHSRGFSVWTPTPVPQEVVVMEWAELGDVLAARTQGIDGDLHWTVTVDVRPYATPLTVEVGYAWGIVTAAMDAVDTREFVAGVNSRRPLVDDPA